MWWHTVTHGGRKKGEKKELEWVTSKRHMTAEHRLARVVQTQQADVHSSPASVDWTDAHADLNGLVRFAERRNLVSALVLTYSIEQSPSWEANSKLCR
jgi:hypothetical protein